ncbi:MAG: murein biosynthesis integral membrane protein MurJ [Candidatus Sungbacteria bacterium]|nr:murein biosynthesis integral membrane protein MurJ [Candidatus Sungbacteria bacterium]
MKAWLKKILPRGSIVLGLTTLGSYVVGLVRDRMFAQTLGASPALDAYNAAFLVPDFLFNLLVASGIAAAAIPLFTQLQAQNRHAAQEYINTLMTAAITTMGVTGCIILLFAPQLSTLVAPGLNEESRVSTAHIMRILALPPLAFAASNALGSLLVAQQRFIFYGLSPIVYNLGIIGGTLYLFPRWGITGIAWGTVFGAMLHLLVRLIDSLRSGWRPRISWAWGSSEMRRTLRLMTPKMIGHPVELITFWVFTSLASLLVPGSITSLNFARNFQSVPVSLIGIAMATAVFPTMAKAALASPQNLKTVTVRTAISILGISTMAAIILFAIRHPLVNILLGGGAFGPEAVSKTALLLGVFCLSIPTESLSHLLARAFYAIQNTTIPVIWGVAGLIVAAGSGYLLVQPIGIIGLPLGFFLGSLVKTGGLAMTFFVHQDPSSHRKAVAGTAAASRR